MTERALIYIPSKDIVNYITNHPVNWMDEYKHLAKLGGVGDSAGVTPTSVIEEFLNLLYDKRALFTQKDFMYHCWYKWEPWIRSLTEDQKKGVQTKLYRNFYSSAIDSLHVWAMLVESGSFEMCLLSATEDAIGKSDLVLRNSTHELRLALQIQTKQAQRDRQYKKDNRDDGKNDCIEVWLLLNKPRKPGNKRWYELDDILNAILANPEKLKLRDTVVA